MQALDGEQLTFRVASSAQHVVQYREDHLEFGARRAQFVRIDSSVGIAAAAAAFGIISSICLLLQFVQGALFARLDLCAKCRSASLDGQPFGVVLEQRFADGFYALPEPEAVRRFAAER